MAAKNKTLVLVASEIVDPEVPEVFEEIPPAELEEGVELLDPEVLEPEADIQPDPETKVLKLSPQQTYVVEYLMGGHTLTNKTALTMLGIGSLSSRISELRKAGFTINERWDRDRLDQVYKKYDWNVFANQPNFELYKEPQA